MAKFFEFQSDQIAVDASEPPTRLLANNAIAVNGEGVIDGPGNYALIGYATSSAGDVNGDGVDDFLFTAALTDSANGGRGGTYVVYGKVGGIGPINLNALSSAQGFTILGESGHQGGPYMVASAAGDLNGDGYGDIVIGAQYYTANDTNFTGRAYVVYGHATSGTVNLGTMTAAQGSVLSGSPSIGSSSSGPSLGASVASAGDVNGDGYDDILIGAPSAGNGGAYSGRAYLVFGSANGIGSVNLAAMTPTQGVVFGGSTNSYAGTSVAGLGDINGDGFADFAIGTYGTDTRRVYVYFGHSGSFSSQALGAAPPDQGFTINDAGSQSYQVAVANAGDINADGYADILVRDGKSSYGGGAYVLFGKAGGLGTIDLANLSPASGAKISLTTELAYIAAGGDVDGDGFDDILIGDPSGAVHSVYIVPGSASFGPVNAANFAGVQITRGASGDGYGFSLSGFDANGDGLADIGVGAYNTNGSGYARGAVYVHYAAETTSSVARTGTIASQSLVGGTGDDFLYGMGGNDTLWGHAGNDTLDGGTGIDVMHGGVGDDTYVVDNAGDRVIENADEGTDTIQSSISYSLLNAPNVENVTLMGAANIDVTGDGSNNRLTGNSGNNTLNGGAGADTLTGGGGLDTFRGGDGDDFINVIGNDYVAGEVYDGGAGTDELTFFSTGSIDISTSTITAVETLRYSSQPANATLSLTLAQLAGFTTVYAAPSITLTTGGSISLSGKTLDGPIYLAAADTTFDMTGAVAAYLPLTVYGNSGNDTLIGSASVDRLSGGAGDDRLIGGGGADTLIGGVGDDIYSIRDAATVVIELGGEGDDIVKTSVGYALAPGVSVETLRALGNANLGITGNTLVQTLVGNPGDNVLDGGGGGDRLKGGYGNDTYIIRDAADVVVETSDSGTSDVIKAMVTYTLGADAWVETLQTIDAAAATALNLTGNDHTASITGNAGANVLTGGAGAETLAGLGGDDTLIGGGGADVFAFASGTGHDTIGDFTQGSDVIDLSAAGFTSFAQVQAASHDDGSGAAVIDLGGGSSVTVTGVASAALQASDFRLGSGGAAIEAAATVAVSSGDIGLSGDAVSALARTVAPDEANLPAQPPGAVRTLLPGTYRDAHFSRDGAYLYASSGNTISVVEVATGTVTATYDLGRAIGALDVSADGRFLAVTPDPGGAQTSATFFRIDLSTGAIETHTFATVATDPASLIRGDFMDIVQLSGNRYLATQQGTGGPIQIDLSGASPAITRISASNASGYLEASPDHTRATVLAPSIYSYVDGTGITAAIYYDPYAGATVRFGPPLFPTSSAFSPDGTFQLLGGTVVNSALAPQPAIQAQIHVPINQAAYSSDGTRLFALTDNVVIMMDATNFETLGVYPVGASAIPGVQVSSGGAYTYSGFGDTLEVSSDGRYVSVIATTGVVVLDLHSVVSIATPGSDDLRGLPVEIGLGGNDLLGDAGGISLYGGAGDDQYTIVDANARIVEYANEGTDTAFVGIATYTLPQFVENATLTSATAGTLVGNGQDNVLNGNNGADYLSGNDGADTIDGGAGADQIGGGSGNDVIAGGSGNDTISGDAGDDTIAGGGDDDAIGGGDGNDQIAGDDGNDTINGGAGADVLSGGNGDDVIASNVISASYPAGEDFGSEIDSVTAGAGSDLVAIGYGDSADGGDGFDTLYLTLYAAPAGVTIDTATYAVAGPMANGGGIITGFERLGRLRATQFADQITVSGLSQPITISGGGGDDVVYATGSRITFDGDSGNDTIDYSRYSTGITVTFTDTFRATGPGGDAISNVDTVVGTAFDDVLTGYYFSGALRGGAGNDWLSSASGSALLYGGAGDDTYVVYGVGPVVIEAADEGIDTIQTYANVTYLAVNVENLTFLGTGGAYLRGNGLANVITGGASGDNIIGGGGSDTLIGRAGDDNFTVGADGDGSTVDGGADFDTLTVTGSVTLAGIAGVEALVLQSGAVLALTGAGFNGFAPGSTISGTGAIVVNLAPGDAAVNAQNLTVAAGSSISFTINGANTGETIIGSASAPNTIYGNDGSDQIVGGAMADRLYGGAGDDRLIGGGGADTLTGGAGDDIYSISDSATVVIELGGEGDDTVKTLVDYVLAAGVSVETLRAVGSANIAVTGNADRQILVGNPGDNILDDGGAGAFDRMKGGYGNDTYIVRNAGDVVVEFSDSGTNDIVKAAVSYTLGADAWVETLQTIDAAAATALNLTGNDHTASITGNAGANVLTGGAGGETLAGLGGDDTLIGGGGADVFAFASGTGHDTIGDFTHGSDVIDLSAAGFTSFAQVQAASHDDGNGAAVIDLGGGSSVTVTGVASAALQSSDFRLGSGGAAIGTAAVVAVPTPGAGETGVMVFDAIHGLHLAAVVGPSAPAVWDLL